MEICILDGFGGGDCVESDGSKKYHSPSEMKDYWATNQADEANFASWCYQSSPTEVQKVMNLIKNNARTP